MEKSLSDYLHVLSSRFYLSDTLKFHSTHVGLTLESRYMTWKDVEMKKYKREGEKRREERPAPSPYKELGSQVVWRYRLREEREREGKKKVVVVFCFSTRTR